MVSDSNFRARKSAAAVLLLTASVVSSVALAPGAQADTRCNATSHSHYHFPYNHSDYYHGHGNNGTRYYEWHVHNHGDYLYKYC